MVRPSRRKTATDAFPSAARSPISRRVNSVSRSLQRIAVPRSPFQLRFSRSRNSSKATRVASTLRSLIISSLPRADSRFQSCRSFLRVEPDVLMPFSRVTAGLKVWVSVRWARCSSAMVFWIAAYASESASISFKLTTWGNAGFLRIATKNAGMTSAAKAGSITGVERNA